MAPGRAIQIHAIIAFSAQAGFSVSEVTPAGSSRLGGAMMASVCTFLSIRLLLVLGVAEAAAGCPGSGGCAG